MFPLVVSSDGRFLKSANRGTPFPLWMDSTWFANSNLQPSDQAVYLADRVAKGFTATLLNALEHKGTLNPPPEDFSTNLPFLKRLDGASYAGSPNGITAPPSGSIGQYASANDYTSISTQAPDFTTPNLTYWNRVKVFLDLCVSYGLCAPTFVSYVGFGGLDEGWMREMVANDAVTGAGGQVGQSYADPTKSLMWNYGAWLATFFASYANIIWIHGGDFGDPTHAFSSPQKAAVDNCRLGMQSITGAASKLDMAHWSRGSKATDVTLTSGAFALESIYTGNLDPSDVARTAFGAAAGPVVTVENRYEGSNGTAPYIQYILPSICSGAAGACFGSDGLSGAQPIYAYASGWQTQLASQCQLDLARVFTFLRSRPWQRMKPSGVSGAGTVVTANGGTAGTSNYVAACVDANATCLYLYIPPAWALSTLTVDLSLLASAGGNAICSWWDRSSNASGGYTAIGTFATSGTHTFTPPGANVAGDTDWVLLCEASP